MNKYQKINEDIAEIIGSELGEKTAELFINLYDGFPLQEQVDGARDILYEIIGIERTNELLKKVENK